MDLPLLVSHAFELALALWFFSNENFVPGFWPRKSGCLFVLGRQFRNMVTTCFVTPHQGAFKSTCVALCSVIALLSFNSRHLYAFIFVLPLVIPLTKKSWKYWVITIAALVPVFSSFFDLLEYANRRMLAILYLSSDQSMITRNILLEKGILGIQKNWFIGDYAGQLRYGSLGSYIHNYLSGGNSESCRFWRFSAFWGFSSWSAGDCFGLTYDREKSARVLFSWLSLEVFVL